MESSENSYCLICFERGERNKISKDKGHNIITCVKCKQECHHRCYGEATQLIPSSQTTKKNDKHEKNDKHDKCNKDKDKDNNNEEILLFECEKCQVTNNKEKPHCIVCYQTSGFMKQVSNNWVHILCALFNDCFECIDYNSMKFALTVPSNILETLMNENNKKKCSVCNESKGFILECEEDNCHCYVHYYCGMENKVEVLEKDSDSSEFWQLDFSIINNSVSKNKNNSLNSNFSNDFELVVPSCLVHNNDLICKQKVYNPKINYYDDNSNQKTKKSAKAKNKQNINLKDYFNITPLISTSSYNTKEKESKDNDNKSNEYNYAKNNYLIKNRGGKIRVFCTEHRDALKHCQCQMPFDKPEFMICCDNCEVWFHGRCVGIDELKPISTWVCDFCVDWIKNRKNFLIQESSDDAKEDLEQQCIEKDWKHSLIHDHIIYKTIDYIFIARLFQNKAQVLIDNLCSVEIIEKHILNSLQLPLKLQFFVNKLIQKKERYSNEINKIKSSIKNKDNSKNNNNSNTSKNMIDCFNSITNNIINNYDYSYHNYSKADNNNSNNNNDKILFNIYNKDFIDAKIYYFQEASISNFIEIFDDINDNNNNNQSTNTNMNNINNINNITTKMQVKQELFNNCKEEYNFTIKKLNDKLDEIKIYSEGISKLKSILAVINWGIEAFDLLTQESKPNLHDIKQLNNNYPKINTKNLYSDFSNLSNLSNNSSNANNSSLMLIDSGIGNINTNNIQFEYVNKLLSEANSINNIFDSFTLTLLTNIINSGYVLFFRNEFILVNRYIDETLKWQKNTKDLLNYHMKLKKGKIEEANNSNDDELECLTSFDFSFYDLKINENTNNNNNSNSNGNSNSNIPYTSSIIQENKKAENVIKKDIEFKRIMNKRRHYIRNLEFKMKLSDLIKIIETGNSLKVNLNKEISTMEDCIRESEEWEENLKKTINKKSTTREDLEALINNTKNILISNNLMFETVNFIYFSEITEVKVSYLKQLISNLMKSGNTAVSTNSIINLILNENDNENNTFYSNNESQIKEKLNKLLNNNNHSSHNNAIFTTSHTNSTQTQHENYISGLTQSALIAVVNYFFFNPQNTNHKALSIIDNYSIIKNNSLLLKPNKQQEKEQEVSLLTKIIDSMKKKLHKLFEEEISLTTISQILKEIEHIKIFGDEIKLLKKKVSVINSMEKQLSNVKDTKDIKLTKETILELEEQVKQCNLVSLFGDVIKQKLNVLDKVKNYANRYLSGEITEHKEIISNAKSLSLELERNKLLTEDAVVIEKITKVYSWFKNTVEAIEIKKKSLNTSNTNNEISENNLNTAHNNLEETKKQFPQVKFTVESSLNIEKTDCEIDDMLHLHIDFVKKILQDINLIIKDPITLTQNTNLLQGPALGLYEKLSILSWYKKAKRIKNIIDDNYSEKLDIDELNELYNSSMKDIKNDKTTNILKEIKTILSKYHEFSTAFNFIQDLILNGVEDLEFTKTKLEELKTFEIINQVNLKEKTSQLELFDYIVKLLVDMQIVLCSKADNRTNDSEDNNIDINNNDENDAGSKKKYNIEEVRLLINNFQKKIETNSDIEFFVDNENFKIINIDDSVAEDLEKESLEKQDKQDKLEKLIANTLNTNNPIASNNANVSSSNQSQKVLFTTSKDLTQNTTKTLKAKIDIDKFIIYKSLLKEFNKTQDWLKEYKNYVYHKSHNQLNKISYSQLKSLVISAKDVIIDLEKEVNEVNDIIRKIVLAIDLCEEITDNVDLNNFYIKDYINNNSNSNNATNTINLNNNSLSFEEEKNKIEKYRNKINSCLTELKNLPQIEEKQYYTAISILHWASKVYSVLYNTEESNNNNNSNFIIISKKLDLKNSISLLTEANVYLKELKHSHIYKSLLKNQHKGKQVKEIVESLKKELKTITEEEFTRVLEFNEECLLLLKEETEYLKFLKIKKEELQTTAEMLFISKHSLSEFESLLIELNKFPVSLNIIPNIQNSIKLTKEQQREISQLLNSKGKAHLTRNRLDSMLLEYMSSKISHNEGDLLVKLSQKSEEIIKELENKLLNNEYSIDNKFIQLNEDDILYFQDKLDNIEIHENEKEKCFRLVLWVAKCNCFVFERISCLKTVSYRIIKGLILEANDSFVFNTNYLNNVNEVIKKIEVYDFRNISKKKDNTNDTKDTKNTEDNKEAEAAVEDSNSKILVSAIDYIDILKELNMYCSNCECLISEIIHCNSHEELNKLTKESEKHNFDLDEYISEQDTKIKYGFVTVSNNQMKNNNSNMKIKNEKSNNTTINTSLNTSSNNILSKNTNQVTVNSNNQVKNTTNAETTDNSNNINKVVKKIPKFEVFSPKQNKNDLLSKKREMTKEGVVVNSNTKNNHNNIEITETKSKRMVNMKLEKDFLYDDNVLNRLKNKIHNPRNSLGEGNAHSETVNLISDENDNCLDLNNDNNNENTQTSNNNIQSNLTTANANTKSLINSTTTPNATTSNIKKIDLVSKIKNVIKMNNSNKIEKLEKTDSSINNTNAHNNTSSNMNNINDLANFSIKHIDSKDIKDTNANITINKEVECQNQEFSSYNYTTNNEIRDSTIKELNDILNSNTHFINYFNRHKENNTLSNLITNNLKEFLYKQSIDLESSLNTLDSSLSNKYFTSKTIMKKILEEISQLKKVSELILKGKLSLIKVTKSIKSIEKLKRINDEVINNINNTTVNKQHNKDKENKDNNKERNNNKDNETILDYLKEDSNTVNLANLQEQREKDKLEREKEFFEEQKRNYEEIQKMKISIKNTFNEEEFLSPAQSLKSNSNFSNTVKFSPNSYLNSNSNINNNNDNDILSNNKKDSIITSFTSPNNKTNNNTELLNLKSKQSKNSCYSNSTDIKQHHNSSNQHILRSRKSYLIDNEEEYNPYKTLEILGSKPIISNNGITKYKLPRLQPILYNPKKQLKNNKKKINYSVVKEGSLLSVWKGALVSQTGFAHLNLLSKDSAFTWNSISSLNEKLVISSKVKISDIIPYIEKHVTGKTKIIIKGWFECDKHKQLNGFNNLYNELYEHEKAGFIKLNNDNKMYLIPYNSSDNDKCNVSIDQDNNGFDEYKDNGFIERCFDFEYYNKNIMEEANLNKENNSNVMLGLNNDKSNDVNYNNNNNDNENRKNNGSNYLLVFIMLNNKIPFNNSRKDNLEPEVLVNSSSNIKNSNSLNSINKNKQNNSNDKDDDNLSLLTIEDEDNENIDSNNNNNNYSNDDTNENDKKAQHSNENDNNNDVKEMIAQNDTKLLENYYIRFKSLSKSELIKELEELDDDTKAKLLALIENYEATGKMGFSNNNNISSSQAINNNVIGKEQIVTNSDISNNYNVNLNRTMSGYSTTNNPINSINNINPINYNMSNMGNMGSGINNSTMSNSYNTNPHPNYNMMYQQNYSGMKNNYSGSTMGGGMNYNYNNNNRPNTNYSNMNNTMGNNMMFSTNPNFTAMTPQQKQIYMANMQKMMMYYNQNNMNTGMMNKTNQMNLGGGLNQIPINPNINYGNIGTNTNNNSIGGNTMYQQQMGLNNNINQTNINERKSGNNN